MDPQKSSPQSRSKSGNKTTGTSGHVSCTSKWMSEEVDVKGEEYNEGRKEIAEKTSSGRTMVTQELEENSMAALTEKSEMCMRGSSSLSEGGGVAICLR